MQSKNKIKQEIKEKENKAQGSKEVTHQKVPNTKRRKKVRVRTKEKGR